MKTVMRSIRDDENLELQLILGGSVVLEKYGRILNHHEDFDFSVDRQIYFLVEGETPTTMAKSAGIAVSEFSTAFESLMPDVVLVIADRFESLAIAMAACYMNIPVAHVEGGEVSGSIDESIRHAITKLSHVHFPATAEAAERIERMGEDKKCIFPVGATSLDVLREIELDDLGRVAKAQEDIGTGAILHLEARKFLVVAQHPVTTEYSENLDHIWQTMSAIQDLKMPTVCLWPNMDAGSDGISKGIRDYREKYSASHVHFFKSLPIELFGPLLKNAACIIGNSSAGIREASWLGTPCVNIGSRQSGRDRHENIIDVGYKADEIIAAVEKQIAHGPYGSNQKYGDGNAGKKIVDVLRHFEFCLQKQITY